MARKDRNKKGPDDVTVVRFRKGTAKEVAGEVKRLIAAKLAEKYADDPSRFNRLVEVGLIDEKTLRAFPDGVDFDAAVSQFRDRLAAMAVEQPSVLGRLEVRPLDVLSDTPNSYTELPAPNTQLSVVFSDLEGFTTFTSRNGDGEASALLRHHYDAVDSIVRGRGGAVVKTIGDGHMLSFGEPRAAVLAGVELSTLDAGPLQVRVGGHNGSVVRTDNDLLGHVVNVAARVTDVAAGGETVVTTSLRDDAGPVRGVVFDSPREEHLKGIDEPLEVCRARHSRT